MGRAKLKMDLIANKKSRVLSYKTRKEGLIKKLHQLTTLCDVAACLIIDASAVKETPGLEIWPPGNPDQVRRLIGLYKSKSQGLGSVEMYGLSDFFEVRLKELEGGLHKLRKKNSQAKYPSWDNNLNSMDESQLRVLADYLQSKVQNVGERIELLKMREKQGVETMNNTMAVDPNFSKIVGYQDMGCLSMIQSNSGVEFPSLERAVMYDVLADDLQRQAHNVGARIEFLKMREKQGMEKMENMMVVDPNLSRFISYEDMGCVNLMQTNSRCEFPSLLEQPVKYDVLASQLPMIGNQDYYDPPLPPLWPMSSYAAAPPANLQWMENMNYFRGGSSN